MSSKRAKRRHAESARCARVKSYPDADAADAAAARVRSTFNAPCAGKLCARCGQYHLEAARHVPRA